MNSYLQKWFEDISSKKTISPSFSGTVEGLRHQHLGPRVDYAKIHLLFEPSQKFEVKCTAQNFKEMLTEGYLEFTVFGLLDVLLTAQAYPMTNISLTITLAEIHPINSTRMAFRLAGRDAARKLLALLSSQRFI